MFASKTITFTLRAAKLLYNIRFFKINEQVANVVQYTGSYCQKGNKTLSIVLQQCIICFR